MNEQFNIIDNFTIGAYSNNNMAFSVDDKLVSIDFDIPLMPYQAFIDVLRFPDMCQHISEAGLGNATGVTFRKDFTSYPLYRFDREKLFEICPDVVLAYENLAPMDQLEKMNTLKVEIEDGTVDDIPFGWDPDKEEYEEDDEIEF